MGIKPKFKQSDVHAELMRRQKLIRDAVIMRLQYLGEQCLIEARTNRTFRDVTGNLISSIGYIVVDHGRVITKSGFNKSAASQSASGATSGPQRGESLALSLANKHPNSYALYMVAGMSYAATVEARGKNVLTSAELYAEKELPKLLARLKQSIKRMK